MESLGLRKLPTSIQVPISIFTHVHTNVHMCLQVSLILRMCLHVHECMSVICVFNTHIDVYTYAVICVKMCLLQITPFPDGCITSISPNMPWVNRTNPLGWLALAFSGRKTGSGLNGRKVGGSLKTVISVMDLFKKHDF